MSSRGVQVWWICGPPGVGKSTVGWLLAHRSREVGVPTGYVDIDQLGMMSPVPPADPYCDGVKARNLRVLLDNFTASGMHDVIVSGVVDPSVVEEVVAALGPHSVTWCRLSVSPDVIRNRLGLRGWSGDVVADAIADADAMERSGFCDGRIDISGMPVDAVVDKAWRWVRSHRSGTGPPQVDQARQHSNDGVGRVLLICGARGVGKSTVGWQAFQISQASGTPTAFLDLAQLGFAGPGMDRQALHRLSASNLAGCSGVFAESAAELLIGNGDVPDVETLTTYRALLGSAKLVVARLEADEETLLTRLSSRSRGEGVRLAGDDLVGIGRSEVEALVNSATTRARVLRSHGVGDIVLDTSAIDPNDVAAQLVAAVGSRTAR